MKKVGEKCLLSELKVGQRAKILKLNETNKAIRRHLLDMGITRGTEILIKKVAPMGDPVDIELRGYELCIRKNEMKNIEVIRAILEKIKEYNRIIIFRHIRPDGDAVGSTKGLQAILKLTFPEKEIYTVGDSSRRYGFMEDCATDNIPDEYYQGALAIILDTSLS